MTACLFTGSINELKKLLYCIVILIMVENNMETHKGYILSVSTLSLKNNKIVQNITYIVIETYCLHKIMSTKYAKKHSKVLLIIIILA